MTISTFSPPQYPQYPLDITKQPRLLKSQQGPGDPSFQADGVNVILIQTTLQWKALSFSEYQSIDGFFTTNAGLPFYYALPDDPVTRVWISTGRRRIGNAATWDYEADLVEQVNMYD
jgi:hypothetical protein